MEGVKVYCHQIGLQGVIECSDGATWLICLADGSYADVQPEFIERLH